MRERVFRFLSRLLAYSYDALSLLQTVVDPAPDQLYGRAERAFKHEEFLRTEDSSDFVNG